VKTCDDFFGNASRRPGRRATKDFLNKINHCPDMTVINPGDNDYVCGSVPELSPEQIDRIIDTTCRSTVKPVQGEDPCSPSKESAVGGVRPGYHVGHGCDPTIATQGCGYVPTVVIKDTTYCIPPPKYAPPPPCVDTGGHPPGPVTGPKLDLIPDWVVLKSIDGVQLDGAKLFDNVNSWGYGSIERIVIAGVQLISLAGQD